MGLETGSLISDLNASWPLSTDQRRFGAPHLRLIKTCIKGQFPSLTAAITLTSAEMNQFIGFNVAAINALTLAGQTSAFYRNASNLNAGQVDEARISESSITQHQAALVLNANQITTTVQTKTASFSVDAGDAEDIIICNSASTINVTLPGGVVSTGDSVGFIRRGSGAVNFVAGSGQTVRTPLGTSILLQHGKAVATYIATNSWELSGNL